MGKTYEINETYPVDRDNNGNKNDNSVCYVTEPVW